MRSNRPTSAALRRQPRTQARRGAYTVEFAVCATVFFTMIFASLELARYVYVRQTVDQVAYEACRAGVVSGAKNSDVTTKANQLLTAHGIVGSTITVTPATITNRTTEVTVEITCNYAANTWVPPSFLPAGTIVTRTRLDHENQAYLVPDAAAQAAKNLNNPKPQDV